jgi:ALIX V-shaped domain binding to HIV
VHNDDISNVLILNKKSIATQDTQIFKAELEKFRPHQNRILQAIHKQTSLLKDLTRAYDALLQDKRVRSEQSKYEAFNRQRSTVISKYRKVYQAFNDLVTGLMRAQGFYSEMKETAESLNKNVITFVENRRVEGAQVLQHIESSAGLVGWERESLNQLMEKMSMDASAISASPVRKSTGSGTSQSGRPIQSPPLTGVAAPYTPQPPTTYPSYRPATNSAAPVPPREFTYNPTQYGPVSPPLQHPNYQQPQQPQQQQQQRYPSQQQQFASPPTSASLTNPHALQHQQQQHLQQQQQQQQSSGMPPPGWQPPPPPPGPPPSQGQNVPDLSGSYPSGPGGYATGGPPPQKNGQQSGGDPWAGLSGWR